MEFTYSTMGGYDHEPVMGSISLLNVAITLPSWDCIIVTLKDEDYPRLHISWHIPASGFVLHCFETGESWGDFLTTGQPFTAPEIEIEMGGQGLEKWSRQLFVPFALADKAVQAFLLTGEKHKELTWIGTSDILREIIWESK